MYVLAGLQLRGHWYWTSCKNSCQSQYIPVRAQQWKLPLACIFKLCPHDIYYLEGKPVRTYPTGNLDLVYSLAFILRKVQMSLILKCYLTHYLTVQIYSIHIEHLFTDTSFSYVDYDWLIYVKTCEMIHLPAPLLVHSYHIIFRVNNIFSLCKVQWCDT